MRLNRLERWLVNQPLRPWTQRWLEAPPLRRLGGRLDGARVLELGCGQGQGQQILRRDFGAAEVCGLDLDADQLRRARRRRRGEPGLHWIQADASRLPCADAVFDAVVSFNALHHVPDWRSAVEQTARVLRPGGRLLLLETLRAFLHAPPVRPLLAHPRADRFDASQLRTAVEQAGFRTLGQRRIPGVFLWLAAERTPARVDP